MFEARQKFDLPSLLGRLNHCCQDKLTGVD